MGDAEEALPRPRRRVATVAAAFDGYAGEHLLDVRAAARVRRFSTGSAADTTSHGVLPFSGDDFCSRW